MVIMSEIIPITERSKNFSLRVVKAFGWLKKQNEECRIIGKQLLRSATSVGANIWEAESGQSKKDRISKLEISRNYIPLNINNKQQQQWSCFFLLSKVTIT